MDRRLAGALLVLLSFVAAAVISSVAGRGLAGSPTVADLPEPPAVGECLLIGAQRHSTGLPSSVPATSIYGPCGTAGAATIGEVVAVRALSGADRAATVSGDGCRSSALTYAGLRPLGDAFAVPGAPPDDPIQWRYSVDVRTSWVTQLPTQPGASSWAACVVRPNTSSPGVGRLAAAFDGGTLPGGYGTCWQSSDLSAASQMVDCREPHLAELIALGRAVGDELLDPDEVRRSCAAQAAIVLRRADPTVGGALAVRVHPEHRASSRVRSNPACFVTTADDRLIVGSLVGLGPAPISYAP